MLPSAPNPISMSQVNVEIGSAATTNRGLNDSTVRTLAGVGGSGTTISFANLRGKSFAQPLTVTGVNDAQYYDSQFGAGTASASPSVNVGGGTPGYSYLWTITANTGSPGGSTLSNATSQSCTCSRAYGINSNGNFFTTLQCRVTDAASNQITRTGITAEAGWDGNA